MKVAVVGAGAIGAYVGAALHRAGAEVHLIARGPHLAAMRRDGVRVLSPRGDFTARPAATDDPSEVGPVDYVFLGLKANSYAASGPLVHPLLHTGTAVIAAQNNGIPWWYFHGLSGPYAGRRIESVDPAGRVSATLRRSAPSTAWSTRRPRSKARASYGTWRAPASPSANRTCPSPAAASTSARRCGPAGSSARWNRTSATTSGSSCSAICNLTLHVQENEIVKVTSPHDNPVTHGNLCIKGRFGFQHVQQR